MIKNFVALDLETTGLDFDKDEIIEVALVRFRDGLPGEEFDTLVKPLGELRHFIQNLTGISPTDLESAPEFATVAADIIRFIGEDVVIAHNASFDAKFLRTALSKIGLGPGPAFLDSLTAARIAWPTVANHKLATLVKVLDIDRSRGHRALPDARACGEVFAKAMQTIAGFSDFELAAVAKVAVGTQWAEAIPAPANSTHDTVQPQDSMGANLRAKAMDPASSSNTAPLLTGDAASIFSAEGPLAALYPDYQLREAQRDMATATERTLQKGGVAFLEASTAVGKTLAYLIPALRKAATGERVVISTATKALQDQIWAKELPALLPLCGNKIEAALVKGRSNFLCLRKFQEHLDHPELLAADEREQFLPLIPWVERTTTGDASENNGFNHRRNHQLWGKLASEASSCVGPACRFHSKCFGLNSRRRAEKANLVLVNHALFLQDMALDFALLPPAEHAIFDEAHRLPQASSSAFGKHIWFFRLRNLLKVLAHTKDPKQGLLQEAGRLLPSSETAIEPARAATIAAEKSLHKLFLKIGKSGRRNKNDVGDARIPFTGTLAAEFAADPQPVFDAIQTLRDFLAGLVTSLRAEAGPAAQGIARDLEGSASALASFSEDLGFLTRGTREGWVTWIEDAVNPHTLHLRAQPLEPGEQWKEKYFPWVKSAVFTSATLSTSGTTDYMEDRMGVEKKPFSRIFGDTLAHDERRRVIIADFLPKPNEEGYQAQLDAALVQLMPLVQRNSLVLYTSIGSLERSHNALSPVFTGTDRQLLSQHSDGNIEGLLDILRTTQGTTLLGTQSLWEGIDLPGKALEVLFIPRLPFPSPGDPIIGARAEAIKARGGNPFQELYIPEAVLDLRQGIGRLLRGPEDSGHVVFFDKRVLTEPYGKKFRRLWGEQQLVVKSVEELAAALQ